MNLRFLVTLVCVTFPLPGVAAAASQVCARAVLDRPSIGLALGGGGARGSSHIGVLRVLEEMRVPVDYVAGTSIGSLVGALYATGLTPDELEQVMLDIDWDDLFDDDTRRQDRPFRRKQDDEFALFGPKFGLKDGKVLAQQGVIGGQKVNYLFETLVKERARVTSFSDLPIPYRAVATDLVTGEAVVLGEGDLALAMRASMSVPGVFDPVVWGDDLLVDGGMANNLPIGVVRDLGADIVIAVNVGTGLNPREELGSVLTIVGQLSGFLTNGNTGRSIATLTEQDVLITPKLDGQVTSADFDKAAVGIRLGYEAADALRDRLRPLALTPEEYDAYRTAKLTCVQQPPRIDFVRLDNESRFDDDVIMERVSVETGEPIDPEALKETVSEIYALGFLGGARYEVVEENGATGVVLHVEPDTRGTRFLETGLDYVGDGNSSSINLRVGYLNTALDQYGSEARVLAQVGEDPALLLEAYKFIDHELRYFVQPALFVERREIPAYDADAHLLFTSEVTQYGGGFAIGREISRFAAIFAGVRLFEGDVDTDVGDPAQPEFDFQGGEYYLRAHVDLLDDRYFPGSGVFLNATYIHSDESLGADDEYEQATFETVVAHTMGRHTLMGGLRYLDTIGDEQAPVYALFRAGGFPRLSGFHPNELTGQSFGMGLLGYRMHVAGSGLLPAYLGATLEYGNVGNDDGSPFDDSIVNGSVYFGYRSPIGPLYVGVGAAEGGRHVFFVKVGNVFGTSSITR